MRYDTHLFMNVKTQKRKDCRMATRKKEKWELWNRMEPIEFGPGTKKLNGVAVDLLSPTPEEIILLFGTTKTGYRQMPLRATQITFKEGCVNIVGTTHLPEYRSLDGKTIRVLDYCPHGRFAEKLEILK